MLDTSFERIRPLVRRIQTRGFRKHTSVFALALVAVLGTLGLFGCGQRASSLGLVNAAPSESVAAKVTIVSDKEPGEPMIISGTIFAPDGRTPLEGIDLFVYQTDATGIYSTRASGGDNRNTRIHGRVRSGADGHYEFRTIKPGSYPASRVAAHIHAFVSGPGYPEYGIDEYHFADDPFVTSDMRGKAGKGNLSSILTLTRGTDTVLRGIRDIKVERCTTNCTGR